MSTYPELKVSLGDRHSCALDFHDPSNPADNELRCWGRNVEGQLGDGTNANKNPNLNVILVDNYHNATSVACGQGHTCSGLDNNSMKCWGFVAL